MNLPFKNLGLLRAVLEAARASERCSREELTVLGNDPYRLDTPAGHRDGAWVAEQLERAIGPHRRIHWRGLHYAIVALGNVTKPNGETYLNTDEDWHWLSDNAGKAARWLGYVDFERITDNRNSDPVIHRRPKVTPQRWLSIELDIEIPGVDDINPYAGVSDFEGRQPYSLAIFGEKASLEDVLLPIAQGFEADLYLPSGEISDTLLWRMAKDGAGDGRPLVVFVVADCDPAGYQMAISIGRKLQALRDLCFPTLEFEVVPTALTVEQVRDLNLPSTPLKETEKRADKWREAFGVEQTEIDALATLRPRDLERIVRTAIEPYFDEGLRRRVVAAKSEWREAAQEALEEQIDSDALNAIRERAAGKLEELKAEIETINDQLHMAVDDIVELPAAIVPEPEVDDEKLGRQSPPDFVVVAILGRSDPGAEGPEVIRRGRGVSARWHVCPQCGLAGWAPEGFRYCRLHGEQPLEEEPFGERPLTAIELVLGRRILKDPPSLRDWIKCFGGYANITAEGWAEYDAARSALSTPVSRQWKRSGPPGNADQPEKKFAAPADSRGGDDDPARNLAREF